VNRIEVNPTSHRQPSSRVWEVFCVFLRLGLTSFGGPVAHLAIFRRELVLARRWVTEEDYAGWVAMCQFLPGPASSQLGFSLGWIRAGFPGALAAFAGFTMPSVILLVGVALGWAPGWDGNGMSWVHGLKLVALAVVSHGLVGMAPRLCPDVPRAILALLTMALAISLRGAWVQPVIVGLGGLAGLWVCRGAVMGRQELTDGLPGMRMSWVSLGVFGILLLALPVSARQWGGVWGWADGMYRAGALVFGGGHVVLPLIEDAVVRPGWMARDDFLAGYGAAQAVPGPMFSLAGYVGARSFPMGLGIPGAVLGVIALFLPGLLLVIGVVPWWHRITAHPLTMRAVAGANAAVVGLLAAAWWDPVWAAAVRDGWDVAVGVGGFLMLLSGRVPVLAVVGFCVVTAWWRG
jgi:chromate transporter